MLYSYRPTTTNWTAQIIAIPSRQLGAAQILGQPNIPPNGWHNLLADNSPLIYVNEPAVYVDYELPGNDFDNGELPAGDNPTQPRTPIQAEEPEIKRVFHPHSKRPPQFQSFEEYVVDSQRTEPTDRQPWLPFRSQLDFDVAEFCETNMLNKTATDTLIKLIHHSNANPKDFTIVNERELDKLWELASHKCTAFQKGSITIQYKNEEKSYDTYTRPLWEWALSLVQDPRLASSFVWDAEKAYKFNGDTYVRFYQEPWTANAFWAAQSLLPNDPAAKAVYYIIYADKSKLSSFGTQKAYAVVARVANIKIGIRNSMQFGGGQVVGHQPMVKDDADENGKASFVNFKNIVWHTAFYTLLESLVLPSKVGEWTRCGDGELRWLWPVILILAADYEEACVMSLIRGLGGLYPCPMCFVPKDKQSDLSLEFPLRTGKDSERIVIEAREQRLLGEREAMLKAKGLRDVDNALWKIRGSDPHSAISYDPLHTDDGGFWGDHLFPQIKERVEALGRSAIAKIDVQMAAFPRWRNLNHFETVMNTSFNDGSKHEDIAKMMLFVAHNVLDCDETGLLLLQALRSYLELRTSISFEVHTSETIAEGRSELQTLDSIMKDERDNDDNKQKNWDVPKFHLRKHLHKNIEDKGACRNFGTKISEAMHGPIRNTYHRMTNFKDLILVDTLQLVKHDHRRTVATFIREQIEALDEGPSESPEDVETVLSNVDIGSKLKPISFSTLEQEMSTDKAFDRFRVKFGDFISDFLQAFGYGLPDGRRLRFDGTEQIVPFQFLKVHYESLSDWKPTVDYLRCNPKFQGHPRYDCVLMKTTHKPIFAQLIYLFSCTVKDKSHPKKNKSHPFALVLPLDAPIGQVKRKDKLLRFRRVRAKPRKNAEFISVHSIIRGAVLAPDFDKPGDFIVFDVLDGDTSLRLKGL
ncbi:hypothetical protein B0H19DRAFT_939007 [Mycena capillaripes]|nr:hypothetical protein B0H19DRAFT_939007 [Mycena capillaripes]